MTKSATLPNLWFLVQADTLTLVCNKRMSGRSYTLLLDPSHVVDADTARPIHVSEFSNEKFSFVIRAVTTSGPHTRIDIFDAVEQSVQRRLDRRTRAPRNDVDWSSLVVHSMKRRASTEKAAL
jgi:hypothetical protein